MRRRDGSSVAAMRVLRRLVAVPAAAMVLSLASPGGVASTFAAPGDIGREDQTYAPLGRSPTGSKPESKLWFNGGWWAVLFSPGAMEHRIHRLDPATQSWIDTGVATDPRDKTRADALWDPAAAKLYVASHLHTTSAKGAVARKAGRLYRYSYDAATGRYAPDTGFPATINAAKSETLVIAKDSTGTLWATWTQDRRVYVNHSVGGDDAVWATPYVVPGANTALTTDDISSIVHFGGSRIGVMWSDQNDGNFHFAVHQDGAPDGVWTASTVPTGGPRADDHINLKADGAGRVYAAVKAATGATRSAPMVLLLVRSPAGTWSASTFGSVADSHTRPLVLLDEQHSVVHMLATCAQPPRRSGQSGGDVCEKTAPMAAPSFAPGAGTPVIRDAGSPAMNDVTSTKQSLNAVTGMVVLANNPATDLYWHAFLPLR
jgi:hypothetical protein